MSLLQLPTHTPLHKRSFLGGCSLPSQEIWLWHFRLRRVDFFSMKGEYSACLKELEEGAQEAHAKQASLVQVIFTNEQLKYHALRHNLDGFDALAASLLSSVYSVPGFLQQESFPPVIFSPRALSLFPAQSESLLLDFPPVPHLPVHSKRKPAARNERRLVFQPPHRLGSGVKSPGCPWRRLVAEWGPVSGPWQPPPEFG